MDALPSLAVVIPCRNAEKWIARAIDSVLAQDYPGVEIIVVDDGSTDRSVEIIKAYDGAVRWELGSGQGACVARNRGLSLAASEYVLFLDADDHIEGPLLRALAESAQAPSADVTFGPSTLEYPDGRRRDKPGFSEIDTPVSIFARIFGHEWVPLHAILWRTEFIRAIGGWDAGMLRNQDGELLSRALLKGPRLGFAAAGCAVYLQHDNPGRISSRQTPAAMACRVDHVQRCARMIVGTEFAEQGGPALAQHAYGLARESYALGYGHLGRRALGLSRELGLARHRGSSAHRLVASVLGLRLAQTMVRARRRMIEAFA